MTTFPAGRIGAAFVSEMSTTQLSHPDHPVPDETAQGLDRLGEQEGYAATQRAEIAQLARPSAEERLAKTSLFDAAGKALGVDVDEHRAQTAARNQAVMGRFEGADLRTVEPHVGFAPMNFEPPRPQRSDPSFWAATWEVFHTPPFTAEAMADGFHFRGKRTSDSGSLQFLTYGEKARYELHADRVPPSASNRWSSAPHVELFGELMAYTGEGDIFEGDCWSKCWMTRRQTLVQHIFGGTAKIGEAIEVQTVFFEENVHRHVVHRLPGFQPMPSIVLDGIFGGVSIWAELEVRFDIQLEGTAFHWIHPFDLLLRGFQWPLIPL